MFLLIDGVICGVWVYVPKLVLRECHKVTPLEIKDFQKQVVTNHGYLI